MPLWCKRQVEVVWQKNAFGARVSPVISHRCCGCFRSWPRLCFPPLRIKIFFWTYPGALTVTNILFFFFLSWLAACLPCSFAQHLVAVYLLESPGLVTNIFHSPWLFSFPSRNLAQHDIVSECFCLHPRRLPQENPEAQRQIFRLSVSRRVKPLETRLKMRNCETKSLGALLCPSRATAHATSRLFCCAVQQWVAMPMRCCFLSWEENAMALEMNQNDINRWSCRKTIARDYDERWWTGFHGSFRKPEDNLGLTAESPDWSPILWDDITSLLLQ